MSDFLLARLFAALAVILAAVAVYAAVAASWQEALGGALLALTAALISHASATSVRTDRRVTRVEVARLRSLPRNVRVVVPHPSGLFNEIVDADPEYCECGAHVKDTACYMPDVRDDAIARQQTHPTFDPWSRRA